MGTPEVSPRDEVQSDRPHAQELRERKGVASETERRLNVLLEKVLADGEEKQKKFMAESEERDKQGFLSKRDSSDPLERAWAASVLPFVHQEHWLLPLLTKIFSDPDPQVRIALIKNFFIRDRSIFSPVYEALFRDPSPLVRAAVINEWPTLLWDRPDLVERYLTDESQEVRAAMAQKWYPFMGHVALVRGLFMDPSPIVRTAIRHNYHIAPHFFERNRAKSEMTNPKKRPPRRGRPFKGQAQS